jgi:EAL and modified HD-GYP domain-containing signal transduction protein
VLAYVARQPVIDVDENTIGYELLFRNGHQNCFPGIDPDEATSKIITHSQLTFGFDQLCQNKLVFINFHEESLLHQFPTSLDKETTIIEILEDVPISDELVEACRFLREQGYRIALDDHNFEEKWRRLYPYIDILKVDISQFGILDLELFAQFVKNDYPNITLLAERVETEKQFNNMKEFGYELFQGYYFARPEIVEQPKLSSNRFKMLKLLALMSRMNATYDEISEEIETDPTISFKLLRFISSSDKAKRGKISSVKHALTYLGLYEIRKFVALIAAANLSEDYCDEIYRIAVVRAKFCEYLAHESASEEEQAKTYLTGLLSMIAPILKIKVEDIIPKLPIDSDIKSALLHYSGRYGQYLSVCEFYERGHWRQADGVAAKLDVEPDDMAEAYMLALKWQSENSPAIVA